MIRLFISYRRVDAEHAAQRVRAVMRARFGDDAVFIDRDIPAGTDWAQYLNERLESATDVIVLVGDVFINELRARGSGAPGQAGDSTDWLKTEIRTALDMKKNIYPVVIGRQDMPDSGQLPSDIGAFARAQAVFAREPAFDVALGKLADDIAAKRGWVASAHAATAATPGSRTLGASVALVFAAMLAVALMGGLIQWRATDGTDMRLAPVFWIGAYYVLLTLLWGLGPYLVYAAVAEARARASLPVHNALGALTMLNMTVALLAGGSFLLLSTRTGWALRLIGLMPDSPGAIHYAAQGVVLVMIVFAAVGVAMLEPVVRKREAIARRFGMQQLAALALAVLVVNLWFAVSVITSMPPVTPQRLVPVIGYFMLAPALPALLVTRDLAGSLLGLNLKAWHNRLLVGLAISLYVACTLSYFAQGPLPLMTGLG